MTPNRSRINPPERKGLACATIPTVASDTDSAKPLWPLFFLLSLAVTFEGFDTKLASLVLPLLGDEFGVGAEVLTEPMATTSASMYDRQCWRSWSTQLGCLEPSSLGLSTAAPADANQAFSVGVAP